MRAILFMVLILPCTWSLPSGYPFKPVPPTKYPVRAVAILRDFDDTEEVPVEGVIVFTQTGPTAPIHVSGDMSGLSPGFHGFHIHQLGNLTDGCKSAGSHFNPDGTTHGGPTHYYRHAGDLGNIRADQDGEAKFTMKDEKISLVGRNSIVGRAVVVHAGPDDLGLGGDEESKKTGNAGGRVACAVIALAKESELSKIAAGAGPLPALSGLFSRSQLLGYGGLGGYNLGQFSSPFGGLGARFGAFSPPLTPSFSRSFPLRSLGLLPGRNPFLRPNILSNPFWGLKRRF